MFGMKYLKLLWPPSRQMAEKVTEQNIGLLAYFCFTSESQPGFVKKDKAKADKINWYLWHSLCLEIRPLI